MDQESITEIYETLAPVAGDYANAQAEQIGMAQASMGPLAQAAMGQSQTAGLGNYTYNRLMRPQVDAMRDELLVQGYTNQLNRALSDALTSAKQNYNRAQRAAATSSSGGSTPSSGGWSGDIETTGGGNIDVQKHTQNQEYQIYNVVSPQGTTVQWKETAGAWDTPLQSYEKDVGYNQLKGMVRSGWKVYDSSGRDISNRF